MIAIYEPSVKLIDYTGNGHHDPLFAAKKLIYTKRTRLEQNAKTWNETFSLNAEQIVDELSYVANSVRSSWEFVTFTFQINDVSRAFTHQLVRTRTCSFAQQSQRSVNMAGFDYIVPESIQNNPDALIKFANSMISINEFYCEQINLGISQQDARGLLPTNVATNIICEMNLRTMADMCGKRDNARAQGEYTKVFQGMAKTAIEVMPWIEMFLYPDRKATPSLDKILYEIRGDICPVDNDTLNSALKEVDKLKSIWG